MGTEISLVNGESHTVKDPYEQIAKFLVKTTSPAEIPAPSTSSPGRVESAQAQRTQSQKQSSARTAEPKGEKKDDESSAEKTA
jgi:hypothetical protein